VHLACFLGPFSISSVFPVRIPVPTPNHLQLTLFTETTPSPVPSRGGGGAVGVLAPRHSKGQCIPAPHSSCLTQVALFLGQHHGLGQTLPVEFTYTISEESVSVDSACSMPSVLPRVCLSGGASKEERCPCFMVLEFTDVQLQSHGILSLIESL
jgi:hypothetical protein